jgi:arylsulfatase
MHKALVLLILISLLPACSQDAVKRPNIILISVDTLRWDYLETYGYPEKDISPAVSWLADNGVVFDQAVVPAGTTIPSHGTMLTGLYPRMHGARSNYHALYPDTETVAQALTKAGYQTGAFVSVNGLLDIGKLSRGFQQDNYPGKIEPDIKGPRSGAKTVREAANWLDTIDMEEPVFLFLHLFEPHGPYSMTEWARERLGDYDGFLQDGVTFEHLRQHRLEILDSEENVAAMQIIYSGEVNLSDQYVGQFLDDWKSRGLLSNTVIIFTADHGQGLGEGRRMGHGAKHAEHVIRAPLILSDFRSPAHQRVRTRVGVIDISATIAELAGLEQKFDRIGTSLLRPESLDPDKPYFAEVELRTSRKANRVDNSEYDPNAVGVWSGDFKLVLRKKQYRMFETFADNRFPRLMPLTEEPIMFDYLAGLIDSFHQMELDMTSGDVSDDQLQQLQGLGYVQ